MRSKLVGAGVSALLCSHAMGQIVGEASWVWEVTTQDGDSVVEPGETAIVDLSIDMEPDVFTGPGGPIVVLGLSGALWDLVGQQNASLGTITDWSLELDQQQDPKVGDSDIFGLSAVQIPVPDTFKHDDPIHVFTFEWTPSEAGAFSVEYATDTVDDFIYVLTGTVAFDDLAVEEWAVNEASIGFEVAPSPGPLGLGAVGIIGALAHRSRRRSS